MNKRIAEKRIGEKRLMNNGEYATIIEYKSCKDMIVKFEDGTIRENAKYDSFKKGILKKSHNLVKIGSRTTTNEGYEIEIIKKNRNKVTIKFLKTGNTRVVDVYSFKTGGIKNPMHPSVYGVGITGEIYSPKSIEYSVWTQYIKKHSKGKIVLCDEWLYLDNFAPFIKGWIPNKSKLECEGSYYSPDTCKFIKEQDFKKYRVKICGVCGKEFIHEDNVYCSKECRENLIKNRLNDDYFKALYEKFDSNLKCRIRLVDESKFIGVKYGADLVCLECGHERYVRRIDNIYIQNKYGCPNCSKSGPELKIYTCKYCNSEYTSKDSKNTEFCSKECSKNAKMVTKVCEFCNNEFIGNKISKFCSSECEKKHRIEKNKEEFVPITKICKCCGGEFKTKYGQPKNVSYCGYVCKKTMQNRKKDQARYKRMRKNGDFHTNITLDILIERDNNICGICGEVCDKNDFTMTDKGYFITGDKYPSIDHIHPISKGGTHTWDNVQLAHFRCNTLKHNKAGDTDGI